MLRLSNLMNALLVVVLLPIVTIINLGSASTSDLDALFLLFYSTCVPRAPWARSAALTSAARRPQRLRGSPLLL